MPASSSVKFIFSFTRPHSLLSPSIRECPKATAQVSARFGNERPLLLLCEAGAVSAVAAARLRASHRGSVARVRGGIEGWLEAGLPVEEGPPA